MDGKYQIVRLQKKKRNGKCRFVKVWKEIGQTTIKYYIISKLLLADLWNVLITNQKSASVCLISYIYLTNTYSQTWLSRSPKGNIYSGICMQLATIERLYIKHFFLKGVKIFDHYTYREMAAKTGFIVNRYINKAFIDLHMHCGKAEMR